MTELPILSQQHLYHFQVCPRRFFLRYMARLPWPEAPLGSEQELAYERGRRFHRWVERHFLGLPVTDELSSDPVLAVWWTTFLSQPPPVVDGQRYPETGLTIPVGAEGRQRLTGRFDLLVAGTGTDGLPAAFVYDWKTGEPRTVQQLRHAWQTKVYLVLLAEGGSALVPERPDAFAAGQLSFTYWYVEDPERPRVIAYDEATHAQYRREIEAVVTEMERQLVEQVWPLTEDWSDCRHCPYRVYCGRQAAGSGILDTGEDEEADVAIEEWLEPQWG